MRNFQKYAVLSIFIALLFAFTFTLASANAESGDTIFDSSVYVKVSGNENTLYTWSRDLYCTNVYVYDNRILINDAKLMNYVDEKLEVTTDNIDNVSIDTLEEERIEFTTYSSIPTWSLLRVSKEPNTVEEVRINGSPINDRDSMNDLMVKDEGYLVSGGDVYVRLRHSSSNNVLINYDADEGNGWTPSPPRSEESLNFEARAGIDFFQIVTGGEKLSYAKGTSPIFKVDVTSDGEPFTDATVWMEYRNSEGAWISYGSYRRNSTYNIQIPTEDISIGEHDYRIFVYKDGYTTEGSPLTGTLNIYKGDGGPFWKKHIEWIVIASIIIGGFVIIFGRNRG